MGKQSFLLCCFILFGIGVSAQKTAKSLMLQNQKAKDSLDIVEKFDSSLAVSAEELKARKMAHQEKRQQLLRLIDASDLKERQKERLRYDLVHQPFSNRLQKFIAELRLKPETKETLVVIE